MTNDANAADNNARTWGPTEVYAAAGVHRGVAHSWIARHLVPLPPGPGMGKERQFSLLEAVCIALIVELTRLGLTIGAASNAANILVRDKDWGERALHEDGVWTLLLEASSAPGGIEAPSLSPISFFRANTAEDRDRFISENHSDTASLVRLNVSAVARRMTERLAGAEVAKKKRGPPRKV
jgi:hypothetical protein